MAAFSDEQLNQIRAIVNELRPVASGHHGAGGPGGTLPGDLGSIGGDAGGLAA